MWVGGRREGGREGRRKSDVIVLPCSPADGAVSANWQWTGESGAENGGDRGLLPAAQRADPGETQQLV